MENKADNGGIRYDDSKPRIDLIPSDALLSLAQVYTKACTPCAEFPEGKYPPRNWERGMLWSRCYNSLMRHALAWEAGEDKDAESGFHHMAHIAWNALALLTYHIRGVGTDDRPSRPKPESRRQTIERLLGEEFAEVAMGRDDKGSVDAGMSESVVCGCARCELRRRTDGVRAVEKQNRDAAQSSVKYKAVEICDDGIFERNDKGERVAYTGPLLAELTQMFRRKPMFWKNPLRGLSEIKIGSKVRLRDNLYTHHRVLADLGNGKFSVCEFKPNATADGPIEVVHLSKIAEVL